jgi:predicted nucleic acid-binding protein
MLISAAGKLTLVLSDFVLEETRRNLALTQPGLTVLERIIREARIEVVSVTRKQVLDAMKWIIPKDAPILAAAKTAQVDMLVSLDKKHILDHPKLETYINAPILTPAEAFQKLKAQP